ncbi:UTP--glucose-1-phosphate uridylyltransferase [Alicyclobacillus mali]|uniref:UTP--glucose-1-phosphate uridylyltransferase n=1 Tax=Alicyclobacillus mali (ex Roth et al. 2021) TaxID=1123961 RepID=A0ABS0F3Q6_9BACL|nr:sugar phosphate nucleotidyltransferase [Alicyclobacillus mali (ex Roth et al. 2021)]MBF8377950.1 UTP--glucose-1-phosphate uridylyltransferase [Alicyclobacillus mali (ex Roth et al. 2021)]MCL6487679.1 UTP--glucose-1-phosphate uridylyltransferase [Alicyclobacillus mali (ex Roth et al. 2021)]
MHIGCAVIPAAGLGTRLRPATLWIPKEMFPILDTPAIAFGLEEARMSKVARVIVVIHPGKRMLVDFVQNWAKELRASKGEVPEIQFVVQERPLGLGHAVWSAKDAVGEEPFYVLLPDELFFAETPALLALGRNAPASWAALVGTQKVPPDEVHQYGMVGLYEGARVVEVVEKPEPTQAPSNVAMVGRYAFQPRIFDALSEAAPDASGEIQLTDAIRLLLPDGVYAQCLAGERFDIGNPSGWARAAQALARVRRTAAASQSAARS